MSDVYILAKRGEYIHTYSRSLREKYKKKGWKYIYSVHGWNIGARRTVKENE
jgi:hypothetical protein